MSLDLAHPAFAEHLPRLSPYLRRALEQAADEALRLHSDAIGLEHLVAVLLGDEDSAVHRLVVHAFADPETVAFDVLALSPGILLVGSDATLPFSQLAVEALRAARARCEAEGRAGVEAAPLLREAVRALPEPARAALVEAGYDEARLSEKSSSPSGAMTAGANLFHHFSPEARRVLSRAGRAAFRAREASIGPARIALAALETDAALEAHCGLPARRARAGLEGRTLDPTPPPERPLGPDPRLAQTLSTLPSGAASLEVLSALHRDPDGELTQAFTRQKVSAALLERARGVFCDPE